jgi:tetratricopeptide (TPR) repeat protein
MGMWDRGAASNVDSYEAARTKSRERDEGLSGGGFHALHWLHYARLQQGRHDEARAVLDTTRHHARRAASGYADYMRWYMPAAHVMGTGEWGELGPLLNAMAVTVDSLDARGAVTVHASRGLAAAQRGDRAAAEAALSRARTALGDSDTPDLRIQVLELSGLLALTRGDTAPALDSLRAAAALEAEQPLDFGPPFPVKPAHELYGEALLRLDRPAEALPQFEETLTRYPGRALALRGKAEAAARAGKPAVAREARAALETQWREADAALRDRLRSLTRSSATGAAESR